MIERYSRPEMAALWTDDARYRRWLDVEIAVCDVLAERGEIPADAAATIRAKAGFDVARIAEIEREVRHDVIAFLTNVAEHVGPESRWVHYGMTSSDVLDTALALQIRDAGSLLLDGLDRLAAALVSRAREHKHTPTVGRTHGVHGEPTTFGLKLLVFALETRRQRERSARALEEAAVGKISGAVGTFAHLAPDVEEAVCSRLGIGFEPAATQVVQRDRTGVLVQALAQVASSLDKFAVEFRHLARTEVREVEEEFGAELLARASDGLTHVLGLRSPPALLGATRWRRAVPQPGTDHPERIRRLRELASRLPRLALAGSYLGGSRWGRRCCPVWTQRRSCGRKTLAESVAPGSRRRRGDRSRTEPAGAPRRRAPATGPAPGSRSPPGSPDSRPRRTDTPTASRRTPRRASSGRSRSV